MISKAQFNAIVELLAVRAHSYRSIVKRTGTSRGTVGTIAQGRHPYQHNRVATTGQVAVLPLVGPIGRCPTCGRSIVLPCLACRTKRLHHAGQLPPLIQKVAAAAGPLGLELRPHDRERYLEVRRHHTESPNHQSTITNQQSPEVA